jgi:hypothetical protein
MAAAALAERMQKSMIQPNLPNLSESNEDGDFRNL